MFEIARPANMDEALSFAQGTQGARWYAGGTDAIPEIKVDLIAPNRLVSLARLPELKGIRKEESGIFVGALTTLAEIARNEDICAHYSAFAQACELAASPQIRNVATIGGNLCQDSRCPYYRGDFKCLLKGGEICFARDGENRNAAVIGYQDCVHVHPSDPANALVALDATISIRGVDGVRGVRALEFFQAPTKSNSGMNVLGINEIIESIYLPRSSNSNSLYLKAMDRAAWTFALASAAVRVELDGDIIKDARIVIGGVAPTPWREESIEEMLRGAHISRELFAAVAIASLEKSLPLQHNKYKVRLARVLVRRALESATGRDRVDSI